MGLSPSSAIADPPTLGMQVRRAVIWRSGSQILAQVTQWGATFLVIRILRPEDYGLFAMTQVVLVLLGMLNGAGLASGLVQRAEVSPREIRQMFGMLLLVNAGLALTQFTLAPLAAAYYRQPLVGQLLRVQTLLYLATPFIALPTALLARALDFRHQARANILASIASATTALGGAFAGLGVWTLVWAPIVLFGVRAIVLTVAARSLVWPAFDFRGAGQLARYGAVMTAGQLTWFAQSQADVFIAGRSFTPHALGLYTTGLFLTQIFVAKFVPPLNEVAFSAYARMQSEAGAIGAAFLRTARMVMTAALPFYLGLAAVAPSLVATMLGARWAETAPIVRVLALAMPFMTLQVLITPACDARGRPGVGVRNGATGAALLASAFLVGVHWGGVGLATAWIAAYPLYLLVSLRRSLPVIGISAQALASAIVPPALAALAMAMIVHLLDTALPVMPASARLLLLVGTGGASYGAWLIIFARSTVAELVATIRPRAVTPAQSANLA